MIKKITIFTAKKIITMNPSNPEGNAVAVRDGRILGVGRLEELEGWGAYELDDTFKDKILLPGFVEAHAHANEGSFWRFPFVGYFDRYDPNGKCWSASKTLEQVIARLKEIESEMTDPNEMMIVWGLDPIYYPDERLSHTHLDQVSSTRPIYILHANGHVATVNSATMRKTGITRETQVEGVQKYPDGEPNGELLEFAAMFLVEEAVTRIMDALADESGIRDYGILARNNGHTTITDLGTATLFDSKIAAMWQNATNAPEFPARMVMYYGGTFGGPQDADSIIKLYQKLKTQESDKWRIGGVKMWLDGSIQGFTARLEWPEHYQDKPNGIWNTAPEQFSKLLSAYHQDGISVHVHCNGDQATQVFIDAVEEALRKSAWLDHRHTVQHCQLTTSAQFRKMANLGMCANMFANHIWYWGDQHYEITVGPERANRMESFATAKREGVPFSFHSDANITPLGHLHNMWCAVNRLTPKGRVLGEAEKIGVYDALYAATIGAAYQLHMDHEIGSIECGKWADFAVLDESPLDVDPLVIKDIPVWGTVLAGKKFSAGK
jgi:predicted amidohydrolase YtcJ